MLSGLGRGTLTLGVDDVVVLDEAGMVGTRDMARLMETTKESGAKLVLVGDPRQLPEIEAGGAPPHVRANMWQAVPEVHGFGRSWAYSTVSAR